MDQCLLWFLRIAMFTWLVAVSVVFAWLPRSEKTMRELNG